MLKKTLKKNKTLTQIATITGVLGIVTSIALTILSIYLIDFNNELETLENSNAQKEENVLDLTKELEKANEYIKSLENQVSDLKAVNASISVELIKRDKSISKLENTVKTNPERSEEVNSHDSILQQEKTVTFNVSAYTAGYESTQKKQGEVGYGVMASGKHVYEGALSCPKEFEFGTKIKLDGLGTFTCEDRGGAITGNHLDIFFHSLSKAQDFGRQYIKGEIINKG